MNLSQSFRKYIESSINNNKAILGTAVAQDLENVQDEEYGTWTVQPLDDEPPIYGVVSGQDNKPVVGSLVVIQFLDDQNAFITHIFSYDTRSVATKLLNVKVEEDVTIESKTLQLTTQKTIELEGNGVKIVSNSQDLGSILSDILSALTAINTAVGALTGAPPAAVQIATLTTKVQTFNT